MQTEAGTAGRLGDRVTRLNRYWNGLCALGIIAAALCLGIYTIVVWVPAYGLSRLFLRAVKWWARA